MHELFFSHARGVLIPDSDELSSWAWLKEGLPRGAQRRMTLPGLMIHHLLEGRPLEEAKAIVYHTTFGESRTMERYLDSFPTPSPMGFQASIHPSGIEQSLILRSQPVANLIPLAGANGFFQALRLAAALGPGSIVVGAEEKGTWLAEHGLSSLETYAWTLTVTGASTAEGRVCWKDPDEGGDAMGAATSFARALAERTGWESKSPREGGMVLTWR